MEYDVVIVGGGPAGLSAALALGRARRRVLLCDAGARRNAAAERVYNFVTRDGTPPDEFRASARQQLARYPNVALQEARVERVSGTRGAFRVELGSQALAARRVLLCTGMLDEVPVLEGFRELWGRSIFQCPYCHAWELQDRRFGYLARAGDAGRLLQFALLLRGWTAELVVFTNGSQELTAEARARLEAAGVRLEVAPVARLIARQQRLEAVELAGGARVPCEVLFAHPPQRQVELVGALGVALDADGYVQVEPIKAETSVPGVFAAGDLTTPMQAAVLGAAAGMRAAAAINAELALELGAPALPAPTAG